MSTVLYNACSPGLETLHSVVCGTGHRRDPQRVLLKCSSTLKLMVIAGVTSPKMCFSLRCWKGDKQMWPGMGMEVAVP